MQLFDYDIEVLENGSLKGKISNHASKVEHQPCGYTALVGNRQHPVNIAGELTSGVLCSGRREDRLVVSAH